MAPFLFLWWETSEIPVAKHSDRTAGEGIGRTVRMYVCEESHCRIPPMNHSNNDGILSAENEEGRLRLKENAFSLDTRVCTGGTGQPMSLPRSLHLAGIATLVHQTESSSPVGSWHGITAWGQVIDPIKNAE